MGIVMHLAKTLDDMAEENHITKYGSVTLQIGEVSGIMDDLFVDAWNYFRLKHPLLVDCELKKETLPGITYCDSCQKTYSTIQFGKICPYCQSTETWLVQGNECIIKEVEAETDDENSESERIVETEGL